MKLSNLFLYLAVWSISLAVAYYLGSYTGNVEPNAEQAVKLPVKLKKPELIQTINVRAATNDYKNALRL